MTKRVIAFWILLTIISGSCTPSDHDELPGINVPISEMNKAFRIDDPPILANTHKNDQILTLSIKNLSDGPIIFSGDRGLKIFRKQAGNWLQVENHMGYPAGELALQTTSTFPPGMIVTLIPLILNIETPESIRIVLVGHTSDSNNDLVAAYIDVMLSP